MAKRKVTANDIRDCRKCLDRITPELTAAAASVGIERRKSTQEMLLIYLAGYHRGDHQEFDQ